MVELLTAGAIKYLTSSLLSLIVKKCFLKKVYKDNPELKYFNSIRRDMSSLKKVLNVLLSYILFCVPYLGTTLFLMDVGVFVVTGITTYKNTDITSNVLKKQLISPEKKVSEIEYNRRYYNSKDLTDSLTIDGADKATIDEVISSAKNELGIDDYEDDRLYDRQRVNAENLHLLEEVSDMVKDPVQLYEYTKDKKITNIDLSDDQLERLVIEMQKLDGTYEEDNSKTITKTFKIK